MPQRRVAPALAVVPLLALSGIILAGWLSQESLGLSSVTPDVRWQKLEAARALAARHQLRVEVVGSRVSDNSPPDTVMEQDPPPGQRVSPRSPVRVVLSKGRETVAVPDLRGRNLEEASALLARAHLSIGTITLAHDSSPWGIVLSQRTRVGTRVAFGTTVGLVLSKGPWFLQIIPWNPQGSR